MEVIASKAFSAFDGIVIHGFEYGVDADKVIFSYQVNGETVGRVHKCTVYNGDNGHLYFRFRGRREYSVDYMQTGRW